MKHKSQPVAPAKRDPNKMIVKAPKRSTRDNIVNRHTGRFQDRTKVKNKRACRGPSSSHSREGDLF